MPIGDWQFWVATAVAALALVVLARAVIPWRMLLKPKRPRATPTGLTIERQPPRQRPKRECH